MVFAYSTHARHWIFTPDKLGLMRIQCDAATRKTLKADINALSVQEQNLLRTHYEYKIPQICKVAGLPEKCQASATIFFKRFYLSYSVMDYDPRVISATCAYVASKTEESRVAIDVLCKRIKFDAEKLLQLEVVVLQGLKFELHIYHPFRPLQGFVMDMADNGIESTELWREAHAEVTIALTTDLPLLYAPSLIALGSLLKVAKNKQEYASVVAYVEGALARSAGTPDNTQAMISQAQNVVQFLEQMPRQPPPTDVLRDIDRKLRTCMNPALNPESDAFKADKAKGDGDKEARRNAKIAARVAQEKADLEMLTGKKT